MYRPLYCICSERLGDRHRERERERERQREREREREERKTWRNKEGGDGGRRRGKVKDIVLSRLMVKRVFERKY
jgi:hypothetical protein